MLCLLVSRNRKALICIALGICAESAMEKPNALIFLFVGELPRSGSDLRWATRGSVVASVHSEDIGAVFTK